MLGRPKFKVGDKVTFSLSDEKVSGEVAIVDAYGTWLIPDEPSYDIFKGDGDERVLVKHVRESVIEKEKIV